MSVDNFWSNPRNLTPPQSMIQLDSPGDLQPGPLGQIPGTSAGALPSAYTDSARAVYPWTFDYTDPDRLDEYMDFRLNRLDQFSSWHSLYQARYLETNNFFSIPATPAANEPPDAYFILLRDRRTVVNVMSLTLADYQKLPPQDRADLLGVTPFMNFTRENLGLVARGAVENTTPAKIAELRTAINSLSGPLLKEADRNVLHRQLDLIEKRHNSSSLVAVQTIANELGELTKRVDRLLYFANVKDEVSLKIRFEQVNADKRTADLESDVRGYVMSSDNGRTVRSGYEAFMRAERAMLTAQLRREAVSRNNGVFDPKQDVANLIYQLQLLYQSEADARSEAGTEEMAQLHRLLSDYAIIQRLVNETLKAFDPKKTDEKRRFLNLGERENGTVGAGSAEQSTPGRSDNLIHYQFSDGPPKTIRPPRDEFFHYAPAYHFYMLAGRPGEARIGEGIVDTKDGRYDSDGDGVFLNEVYNVYRPDERNAVVLSGGLSEVEMRIVGMFANEDWGSGEGGRFQAHPLELLYGAKRPLSGLTDETNEGYGSLSLERRDFWDKWSTQLADNVTILNQKNQLKQNEIESDTKQSNRHFDLGNNALRKMNEMLMSIGRM